MNTIDNPEVAEVFSRYPHPMRKKLQFLRSLVLETASETEGVGAVEETLKWSALNNPILRRISCTHRPFE